VTKSILKEPKIVLIDKIYYLDHSTDKQMQLISILLTATLARFFSLQATRPERKENSVDIMSVHCISHGIAVTYHRASATRHGSLA